MTKLDKKRANEILLAYACCSFTTVENKLCNKCLWKDTEDCEKTMIDEETIIEVINTLRG